MRLQIKKTFQTVSIIIFSLDFFSYCYHVKKNPHDLPHQNGSKTRLAEKNQKHEKMGVGGSKFTR